MLSPRKTRLILNPHAGRDTGPGSLEAINERLRTGERGLGEMDIVMTVAQGDATAAAKSAAESGYDLVLIAGGDGTLNEVLNGVAQVPGALSRVTMGVVPLGTGNDFAAALGLPAGLGDAIDTLLEGETLAVDVGVLNGRHFVNVSAGGFIGEVSDAVDPQLKTVAGRLAYLIGGAQVLLDYEPVGVRLVADGPDGRVEHEGKVHLFAVCNARMAGGGRLIAPYAKLSDGALDVCILDGMPTLEFVSLLPRVSRGEHVQDDRVGYFRASTVDLTFDRPIHVNTDGEVLEATSCRYEVLPRAARFLAGRAPFV